MSLRVMLSFISTAILLNIVTIVRLCNTTSPLLLADRLSDTIVEYFEDESDLLTLIL